MSRTEFNSYDLCVGDLVLSKPNSNYSCFVGTVICIVALGTPEHNTESDNLTDNIHVDFACCEYSDGRIAEIEEMMSALYGSPRLFDECPLDDVIMAPEELIRITGIEESALDSILSSEEYAERYCANMNEAEEM